LWIPVEEHDTIEIEYYWQIYHDKPLRMLFCFCSKEVVVLLLLLLHPNGDHAEENVMGREAWTYC
jgi:hypothetical protein